MKHNVVVRSKTYVHNKKEIKFQLPHAIFIKLLKERMLPNVELNKAVIQLPKAT